MSGYASYAEQGLASLKDLLVSDSVNEIVINPNGTIFVEFANKSHMEVVENRGMDNQAIQSLGNHLAGETRNALGKEHPIVSGRINVFGEDMRVQVVVPPAVEQGVSVSIRKYVSRVLDVKEIGFVAGKQINMESERSETQSGLLALADKGALPDLFQKAIDYRLNILISGGTSSGKTTVARALLGLTDIRERLVTIEDAIELRPLHDNQVALVANRVAGSKRSPARLLESSLRMRPDRLILGEIRGSEALNFLEAINTGHPGSISTIHADSPKLALERIVLMVIQTGIRQTRQDIIEYATKTIDMIVQVGRRDGKRGVLEIYMPSSS